MCVLLLYIVVIIIIVVVISMIVVSYASPRKGKGPAKGAAAAAPAEPRAYRLRLKRPLKAALGQLGFPEISWCARPAAEKLEAAWVFMTTEF